MEIATRSRAPGADLARGTTPGSHVAALAAVAAVLVAGLALLGRLLFRAGGKSDAEYLAHLGELVLQLAVIVVVGAVATGLVDWWAALRARAAARREARLDFLRRISAVHVAVAHARDLLNAHRSPKTYGEQLRRLMELRPVVEEIADDLRASHRLFHAQESILGGLDGIAAYLRTGAEEYVRHHGDVDPGSYTGRSLDDTIESAGMPWVRGLMREEADFRERYEPSLVRAKVAMREEIYAG